MKDADMEKADPILLTPGPLTTSRRTKEAMLHDYGSREDNFIALTAKVRELLVKVIHGEGTHVCVPLQGSGTFVVEAMLGTLVPKDGHVLVPANGAYCQRIAQILRKLGRRVTVQDYTEATPVCADEVERALAADKSISHVAAVHCETSTGVLNPLEDIARAVAKHGRSLLVDAMSSLAAVEIDARETPFDALVAASGKCLEGPPGMGFALIRKSVLEKAAGNSPSLVLDLHDQWVQMEKTKQWRFTPPTHVVAALAEALDQFFEEGGTAGRGARYATNCARLIDGMEALGLKSFLPRAIQAPVIVTFHAPADPAYRFERLYDGARKRGFILYPGKLTKVETFRVGCIGHVDEDDVKRAIGAIKEVLEKMGVKQLEPVLRRSQVG
jgi:2-aminoethylphosphonate-pyruvate transaminase